ncbi:FKBP-type peptidyl-prolyl cis-trans isomerase [Lysinibacter sp. HNR]|uniref:FKBP-type peptidyl-prolyl cis-trans isomerase n=1 Tax=Lysinibacter sp. HNR TaxID=3031408 RepID=UPI002435B3A3|nr:FKBP-type peptidyl-prolyl cis-trans isomerase [Lysinibacter sp. HNR]WGD37113.1 FKBP-type peptidyl-prolyl cis-trans isomerase [Lysinibacter sp. HNR]
MKIRSVPILITALALTLAGCSAGGDLEQQARDAGCVIPPSGEQSDSIKVTGNFGEEPQIEFDAPLTVDGIQRSLITRGDGAMIVGGDTIESRISLFNGESGDQIISEELSFPLEVQQLASENWLTIMECMPVGSRAVSTMTGADLYGETGNENFDIGAETSLIIVVDAIAKGVEPANCTDDIPADLTMHAEGRAEALPEDFPEVTRGDNGEPTITFPEGFEPANELKIAVSITGDGKKVEEGDCVTVQYRGINQVTGEIFDESWSRGEPAQFTTEGVIPGFSAALVGQSVGSQVVVLINPENGYGEAVTENASTGYIAFVVDILATKR